MRIGCCAKSFNSLLKYLLNTCETLEATHLRNAREDRMGGAVVSLFDQSNVAFGIARRTLLIKLGDPWADVRRSARLRLPF